MACAAGLVCPRQRIIAKGIVRNRPKRVGRRPNCIASWLRRNTDGFLPMRSKAIAKLEICYINGWGPGPFHDFDYWGAYCARGISNPKVHKKHDGTYFNPKCLRYRPSCIISQSHEFYRNCNQPQNSINYASVLLNCPMIIESYVDNLDIGRAIKSTNAPSPTDGVNLNPYIGNAANIFSPSRFGRRSHCFLRIYGESAVYTVFCVLQIGVFSNITCII